MISENLPVMQEERGKFVIFAVGQLRNLCLLHPSLFLSILYISHAVSFWTRAFCFVFPEFLEILPLKSKSLVGLLEARGKVAASPFDFLIFVEDTSQLNLSLKLCH